MKLHTFLRVAALATALGFVAKSTTAAPIVFSDHAAFLAAAGATSVSTFDDLDAGAVAACLPAFPYTPDPCVLPYGDASYVATVGLPDFGQRPLLSADPWTGIATSNSLHSNVIPLDNDDFYFTFGSTAVGFEVWAGDVPEVFIEIEDVSGAIWSYSVIAGVFDGTFFGAVSDVGLERVNLYTAPYLSPFGNLQTVNFAIDDVELGVATVPEPATFALLAGGLAAVVRRRLRKA